MERPGVGRVGLELALGVRTLSKEEKQRGQKESRYFSFCVCVCVFIFNCGFKKITGIEYV